MRPPIALTRCLAGMFTFGVVVLASGYGRAADAYATAGDCDGFPRIAVKTAPGMCVGLVAAQLGFPRGVVARDHDIYVVDMGGWRPRDGRVLKLGDGGRTAPQTILSGLDEPSALAAGPDGSLYVGQLGRIVRFDPGAKDPAATLRDVVIGLPTEGRNPLAAIAAGADGTLFVNVGSATDHCEGARDAPPDPAAPCPETLGAAPRGVILRVTPGAAPVDVHGLKPFATGLRNSVALAVLPAGDLLAAVNARDYIDHADPSLSDEDLPHDTFDRVEEGADYGWPYCYDQNVASPEYRTFSCAPKHHPTLLLPPHAAPLGMLLYRGGTLPGLAGRAVIAFHGYRDQGHRLVALPVDAHGIPTGKLQDVVGDWDAVSGKHPQGAPVSLFEQEDGSILITEDHNGTLLRLARAGG